MIPLISPMSLYTGYTFWGEELRSDIGHMQKYNITARKIMQYFNYQCGRTANSATDQLLVVYLMQGVEDG